MRFAFQIDFSAEVRSKSLGAVKVARRAKPALQPPVAIVEGAGVVRNRRCQ